MDLALFVFGEWSDKDGWSHTPYGTTFLIIFGGNALVQRAQMVLCFDQGQQVRQIAQRQRCRVETVRTWLHRYQQGGVAGLEDLPHGRPRRS